jgi:eukaryotic-like serine/threonine-protein kinase
VSGPIIADTGGLLRALARKPNGKPSFPDYEAVLTSATLVLVPALVLAEVDYFLREQRRALRKLIAEIFDPATRYEYELPLPSDLVRGLEFDAKFKDLNVGLVDGTVAALAERRKVHRVLTTDRRDFSAIRVGLRYSVALELLPCSLRHIAWNGYTGIAFSMAALTAGTRLGPYEIVDLLGAGGMGEVYRARDTRLDRIVAIKVLSSALASDPQLRERFEREARAISVLNHPNICVLHDVGRERPIPAGSATGIAGGEESAVDFLVMEYLEGETLAARLARGVRATRSMKLSRAEPSANVASSALSSPADSSVPPISADEALSIAIPIARALDRAHRQGIVHRDLKPGNVMLTKREADVPGVKLLDFGLARLTRRDRLAGGDGVRDGDGVGQALVSLADLASPTMSTPLTVKGVILGTLQYMSPEQIEGREIDARTDIFAFGAVLYEMLTGRKAFAGKSQASVIGAILDHDPGPVSSLQPTTPPILDEIVRRSLAKDPDDRWQSARDVMRQLEWVAAQGHELAIAPAAPAMPSPTATRSRLLFLSAALVAGATLATATVAWLLWPTAPPPVITRFTISLPEDQRFTRGGRRVVAVSPDGTELVYVANQRLYLRNLRDLTAAPIPGTEGSDPAEPVFSPDGQWVAFTSPDEGLKKIPVMGGTPVVLSAAVLPFGTSWEGERILLGQPGGIVEIPANGGTPKPLVVVDEKAGEQARDPQLVARGRAMLFTLGSVKGNWDAASIVVQDLATNQRKVLFEGGADARVLPTGHLVYTSAGTLFAVPFDEARLAVIGTPVPIQQGFVRLFNGVTQVAWSASGTFVMAQGIRGAGGLRAPVWVGPQGQEEHTPLTPRNYGNQGSALRLSKDAKRVAVTIFPDDILRLDYNMATEVYVGDLTLGTLIRLSDTGRATSPVWTQDGRVCYASNAEVFCQADDGSGPAKSLFKLEGLTSLAWFSSDGTRMVLETQGPKTGNDIVMATIGQSVEPLLNSSYSESAPAISPDGRWMAYVSNESGRAEVYVRSFPAVDQRRVPISTGGGSEPRWARDGRALFFTVRGGNRAGVLMSVPILPGSTFIAGRPTTVLKIPSEWTSFGYDVAPDGRFLIHSASASEETRQEIVVVQNWFDELRARVPIPPR